MTHLEVSGGLHEADVLLGSRIACSVPGGTGEAGVGLKGRSGREGVCVCCESETCVIDNGLWSTRSTDDPQEEKRTLWEGKVETDNFRMSR